MSKFDELKRLAQQATGSQWEFDRAYTPFSIQGGEVVGDDELPWGDVSTKEEYEFLDNDGEPTTGPLTICPEIGLANGRFIAAANPAAVLELLAIQAQLVEALKGLDDSFCSINEFSTKEERHQARMNLIAARAAVAAAEEKP